jgi:hypothetical protein
VLIGSGFACKGAPGHGRPGLFEPVGYWSPTASWSWLKSAAVRRGVGTLWGLTPCPLLTSIQRFLSWLRSLLQRPQNCSTTEFGPFELDHACAAFEQGDWLAELDLLQLGTALQRSAIARSGYDGRSFDLMVAIADVLEADHGWSFEQSDAWLERMGLWEEEF